MKPFLISLLYCFSLALGGFAQPPNQNLLRYYRQTLPFEKVYLHTDQRIYAPGDALWFRAYLADDSNHPIYTRESKIQVQLLDPAGKIINELNLEILPDHLSNCIIIPAKAEAGVYTLRAATPWLFNFGQDAFFEQKILVWPFDLEYPIKSESLVQNVSPIQIQFFPEGGDLVADFRQKVAFKSWDNEGETSEAKGTLYNNQHQQILNFASFHQGMGCFSFMPKSGERYYALFQGRKDTFWLSVPRSDELALRVDLPQADTLPIMVWKRNPGITQVLLRSKDSIFWQQKWFVPTGETRLNIPISSLPIGIAQVIVLDENARPYAERLVFLHRERQAQVQVKVKATPAEAGIEIYAHDDQGKPLEGLLSLAVVEDQHWQMLREQPDNILSHFLLSAELKGKIADPTFYFQKNEPKAPAALDLVLLCHGWRKFSWKEIQSIDPQRSNQLVAYPRLWEIRGQLIMGKADLFLPKSKIYLQGQKTFIRPDSLGNFKFVLPGAQIHKLPIVGAKFRSFKYHYAKPPLLLPELPWPKATAAPLASSFLRSIPDSLGMIEFPIVNKLAYRPPKSKYGFPEAKPVPATFNRVAGVSVLTTHSFGRDLSSNFGDDLFLGSNASYNRFFTFYLSLKAEPEDFRQKEGLYERVFAALPGSGSASIPSTARRHTLHWAPQVLLKNGQGKLLFSTPTQTGTYRIIAEGLSLQGLIIHTETVYQITKAE